MQNPYILRNKYSCSGYSRKRSRITGRFKLNALDYFGQIEHPHRVQYRYNYHHGVSVQIHQSKAETTSVYTLRYMCRMLGMRCINQRRIFS